MKYFHLVFAVILLTALESCTKQQPEISFGTDDCDYCKMKLMDNKFGLLGTTDKGRMYKFDDYHCYEGYVKENNPAFTETWVVSFDEPGKLIPSQSSFFVEGTEIKSPMGSGIAFFKNKDQIAVSFPKHEREGAFSELNHK